MKTTESEDMAMSPFPNKPCEIPSRETYLDMPSSANNREPLKRAIYMDDCRRQIHAVLSEYKISVATAESCTAGEMAATLTQIPGASNWFSHGFVTYSEKAKRDIGVLPTTIEKYSVYSEECAIDMAYSSAVRSGAIFGVGITGVVGPDSHNGIEPGTVWIANYARGDGKLMIPWRVGRNFSDFRRVLQYSFSGSRNAIRTAAAQEAIIFLSNTIYDWTKAFEGKVD